MTGTVGFATVTTTLPSREEERPRLLQRIAERDQQLADYGRYGYRLVNTVTVTGSELVTVVDTLTREAE